MEVALTEKTLNRLIEKVNHKYYGKYRGIVVDNEDPEKLGRLKVKVPILLGNGVVTGWAMPCLPYGGITNQGFLAIPEVDAGVWVEFEAGDLEYPIWVGTYWGKPGGESELPKPNKADGSEDSSVQDQPTRKIIKTKQGHTIQFEDADNDVRILIGDGENENYILLGKEGISIVNKENSVKMTDEGVVVEDKNKNKLTQDANGIVIEDKNKNAITMDAVSGFPAGQGIKLNGGTGRVCLESLITWLLSHQHVGNMGAPTPIFPANMVDLQLALAGQNSILSKKLKVE